MRLIDADALTNALELLAKYEDDFRHSVILGVVGTIRNTPTVDAVVLPCSLGTTLYRVCEERLGRKPFIRVVRFDRNNFARIVLDGEIGKTVFLTREEAEAALAERKDDGNQ